METKYVCKIIYKVAEKEDAVSTLKEVPYLNPDNNIYDFLSGPAGNMMCASFANDNHLVSFVIPILKGNEVIEYINSVKDIAGVEVYICGWDGKSESVHVWRSKGSEVVESDVNVEERIKEMDGYLQFDDPSSFDDMIDNEKYVN